jgi:hypothetical protein
VQRRRGRYRDRRRLLERQARRLGHHLARLSPGELGERARAKAEHRLSYIHLE